MQSKKGIYLLTGLIATILIFFSILFFVHENTLENGILFTVSFEYENAKEIQYHFYNQNGKIEKEEKDNRFLLEKTDYSSVKLLRRITKKLKESKEPFPEEGISIYNGQNKRYYLIPYDSEAANELSNLIIDGYIHSEMERITNKKSNELYIYQTEEKLDWTKDGSKDQIIHTYTCANEECNIKEIKNAEMILWDNEYYLYNYETKQKEELYIKEEAKTANLLLYENQILGIEVINEKGFKAFYDLNTKEYKTDFTNDSYTLIDTEHLLMQKTTKKENKTVLELCVYNYKTKETIWKKELEDTTKHSVLKIKINEVDYYVLKKETKTPSYQLLNNKGEYLLKGENLKVTENGDFIIYDTQLLLESSKYRVYDEKGRLIKEELLED